MADEPSATPKLDPIIGRMAGNYVLEAQIGAGGMGAVYLARHQRLNKLVAVKVLLPTSGKSKAMALERFEQEAQASAMLSEVSHRIVAVHDVGEWDGWPYMVMDYVKGGTLRAELKAGNPMPAARALAIAYRVADTLAICHAKGVVHRDVKPDNMMLVSEGARQDGVRILDFGAAHVTGELKRAQTTEGQMIGTATYISPESALGYPTDGRADVFSLGCMLFEMVAGAVPWPAGKTFHDSVTSMIAGTTPTVASRRPPELEPVPPIVEEIIAAALQKEPPRRPAMDELARMLGAALEIVSGSVPSAEPPQTPMSVVLPGQVPATEKPTEAGNSDALVALLRKFNTPAIHELSPESAARTAAAADSVNVPRLRRPSLVAVAIGIALTAILGFGLLWRVEGRRHPSTPRPAVEVEDHSRQPQPMPAPSAPQTAKAPDPAQALPPANLPPTAQAPGARAAAQRPKEGRRARKPGTGPSEAQPPTGILEY